MQKSQVLSFQRQHSLLQMLSLRSSLFYAGTHCGEWGSAPPERRGAFHLVLEGSCTLEITETKQQLLLETGDFIVFWQPIDHQLHSTTKTASVSLLCGYVEFDQAVGGWLMSQLPDYAHFSAEQADALPLACLRQLLNQESKQVGWGGGNPVLEKLSELVLYYALRHSMAQPVVPMSYGLLSLAQDDTYGVLFDAVWQQPQKPWDVESLAGLVNVSKASLHRHLRLLTGLSPAQLVSLIRIYWSQEYLKQNYSIEQVAEKVGYSSASALSHAFKRQVGLNPAEWRDQAA